MLELALDAAVKTNLVELFWFFEHGIDFSLLVNTNHVYEETLGFGGDFLHRLHYHINMVLINRVVLDVNGPYHKIQVLVLVIIHEVGLFIVTHFLICTYEFFEPLIRLLSKFIL